MYILIGVILIIATCKLLAFGADTTPVRDKGSDTTLGPPDPVLKCGSGSDQETALPTECK